MMKKPVLAVSLLIIMILSVNIFISCDKDTDCTILVTVIDGQTQKIVPGANVYFGKDSSDYNVTGLTDSKGQFVHTYKSPAIYDMEASIDYQAKIDETYYWAIHKEGHNSFRLREGDTIKRDLILTQSDSIKKLY